MKPVLRACRVGATLAALLARRGVRVALLEAATRGTGSPMSTHYVQPPGMDVLDELGVGDQVRAVTPAVQALRYVLDENEVFGSLPHGRPGSCVRRSTIDPMLQTCAEASGAVLLDRHRAIDLVRDGERVVGVVARGPRGEDAST